MTTTLSSGGLPCLLPGGTASLFVRNLHYSINAAHRRAAPPGQVTDYMDASNDGQGRFRPITTTSSTACGLLSTSLGSSMEQCARLLGVESNTARSNKSHELQS